jgi:uncharacterized phage protein (TIGR01671 family)
MRENKFRGLRTDGGGWVEGNLVIFENGQACIVNHTHLPKLSIKSERFIEVHPETVGQFTGLKDKNGKEIFEGDLIILGSNSCNLSYFDYEVIYQVPDFVLKRSDLYFIWGRLGRLLELGWECEIIGNIHEKQ